MGTLKTKEKKLLIIENFLQNLGHYLPEIYKIILYNNEEFNKKFNVTVNWPGKRSESLNASDRNTTNEPKIIIINIKIKN